MSRWEQKRKEQSRERTPRVVPTSKPKTGRDARRGSGLRNREPFELPAWLTPSVISTPRNGERPKPQKQAAPAEPAETPYRSRKQGLDATYPDRTPSTQSEKPGGRTNVNGLVSYGKDLSSLNAFTKEFTGGYELTDIKSAFQSNDLTGAYQNGSNTISTDESKYTLPDGATPSNVGGKYSMGDGDISIENTGYKINPSSVPGTVGGNPSDPQDGTSDKPDIADNIRQVRMRRKGPRDDGGPRDLPLIKPTKWPKTRSVRPKATV